MYDSLNVFLACNIFSKDRKKVTFNPEVYECLPLHFKDYMESLKAPGGEENKSSTTTNVEGIKMVTSPPSGDSTRPKLDPKKDSCSDDSENREVGVSSLQS